MAKFITKTSFFSALETIRKHPWAVFNTEVKEKTTEMLNDDDPKFVDGPLLLNLNKKLSKIEKNFFEKTFYSALETIPKHPWAVFNIEVKGKTTEMLNDDDIM
jgi:hypothetical protein